MTFRFDSLMDFMHMDGHGVFVWSAYAISLLVMVWLVASPWIQQRRVKQQLLRQYRRDAARTESTPTGG